MDPLVQSQLAGADYNRDQLMVTRQLAHLKATPKEVETALNARLDQVRVWMLADTVQASPQTTWEAKSADAPRCPGCDRPLQSAGKRRRRWRTRGDQSITLGLPNGECPACGQGFPPWMKRSAWCLGLWPRPTRIAGALGDLDALSVSGGDCM